MTTTQVIRSLYKNETFQVRNVSYFTVNTIVPGGSFMAASNAIPTSHMYTGLYYGIVYINIPANASVDFLITLHSVSQNLDDQAIGMQISIPQAGQWRPRYVRGTYDGNGGIVIDASTSTTEIYTVDSLWHSIAWWISRESQSNDSSMIWVDGIATTVSPPSPGIDNFSLGGTAIMLAGTPANTKIGPIYTGVQTLTRSGMDRIMALHSQMKVPMFLGPQGSKFGNSLGLVYIDCIDTDLKDLVTGNVFAPVGTVDYTHTHGIVKIGST